MDDITIHGEATDVVKYLDYLYEKLPGIGLIINTSKSEIFGMNTTGNITNIFSMCNIPIQQDGIEILGCPIGKDNYVDTLLKAKYKKFKKTLDTLPIVKTAVGFPVLRSCINTKPIYLTRTCPPWFTQVSAHFGKYH